MFRPEAICYFLRDYGNQSKQCKGKPYPRVSLWRAHKMLVWYACFGQADTAQVVPGRYPRGRFTGTCHGKMCTAHGGLFLQRPTACAKNGMEPTGQDPAGRPELAFVFSSRLVNDKVHFGPVSFVLSKSKHFGSGCNEVDLARLGFIDSQRSLPRMCHCPKKRERTHREKDGYGTLADQRSLVSTDDVVTQQDGDMGNRSPTNITIHARETHVGEGGSGFGEEDRRCPGPRAGPPRRQETGWKVPSVPFLEHGAPPAHGALRNGRSGRQLTAAEPAPS